MAIFVFFIVTPISILHWMSLTYNRDQNELHDVTLYGTGFIGERKNKAESSRGEGINLTLLFVLLSPK